MVRQALRRPGGAGGTRIVRLRGPRGFVLIVVVICGVAMLVIAMAIVFTGGAGALNAIKDASIDRSSTIADAGMERATAYAKQVVKIEDDFDRLLDPALSVDCAAPPSPPIAPGRPRYSGATTVTFPAGSGVTWAVVPFNDGAYLTRFDDDDDDSLANARLGSFSGNNLGVGGSCDEGPGTTNERNPFRDRNRAVWISVIGIYPGTDPENAQHRTALRRFYIADEVTPVPVIATDDNFDTGHLNFCSTSGDIAIGNNANLSNQTDTCGTLSADHLTGNASGDASAFCASRGITCTHGGDVDDQDFDLSGAPFDQVFGGGDARDQRLYDWTSPCNFYVDSTGLIRGLWFWNAGSGACAGYTGNLVDPNLLGFGACWVPLMLNTTGNTGVSPTAWQNLLGWSEVVDVGGNLEWRPQNSAQTVLLINKPNWQTACPENGAPSDFAWSRSGGATVDPPDCTSCNGSNRVIRTSGTNVLLDILSTTAVPTGVYFFKNSYTFGAGTSFGGGALTGATKDTVRSDWPMMTIVVEDNATLSASGRIGVGTGKAFQPSLFVGNDLTINAGSSWAFAGSVYAGHDANFDNGTNVEAHGLLWVGHSLTIGGGGKLDLLYDDPLVPTTTSAVVAAPTVSRTLR